MTATKQKLNGPFIIVGLMAIAAGFYHQPENVVPTDLVTQTITLTRNPVYSKSRVGGSSCYELWTRETKACFIIDVAGAIAAKWARVDSLRSGDTLTIKYDRAQTAQLNDASGKIPIYHLEKGNQFYFGPADYYAANKHYANKLTWFAWIFGVLLLLNGLTILTDKATYLVGGIGLALAILLRLLGLL